MSPRECTNALLEMIDQGIVLPEQLCRDLLMWMSEADVEEFAHFNEYLIEEEEEESLDDSD